MFIFRKKVANYPFFKKIYFNFESYKVPNYDEVLRVMDIPLDLYKKDIDSKSYHLFQSLKMNKYGTELQPTIYFVKGLNFLHRHPNLIQI